jgi:Xaa-Pro dipeptidase
MVHHLVTMETKFVAGFGPIVRDPDASRDWWQKTLGQKLKELAPDYYGTDDVDGVKAFALWPLAHAAENTFGTADWPADLPIPQAWIELDVASADAVREAAAELVAKGHTLLREAREEPWKQTTARLISPEGLLVGISFTPWMHPDPLAAAPTITAAERAEIVQQRIDAVRDILRGRGADAVLLDSRHDFAWLTLGGQNHVLAATQKGMAPILITRDDATVLAPINEIDRIADEEVPGLPLKLAQTTWWPTSAPADALAAEDLADELESLRTALHPVEHERMRWIANVVDDVFAASLADLRPGRTTEDDLVADATARFLRHGVRLPVVLVAADERIDRYRHPLSAGKRIDRRVMLIVCAERWGVTVAHTQFVELAEPTPEITAAAKATAHVLAAMRDATTPGSSMGDVLAASQRAYAEVGMPDEWKRHHQGGSIGYQARERVATPNDDTPIRAGMAFAWNPSVVGHKREETLYLDESGARHILTTTPDPG